jgi:hypothetical protein
MQALRGPQKLMRRGVVDVRFLGKSDIRWIAMPRPLCRDRTMVTVRHGLNVWCRQTYECEGAFTWTSSSLHAFCVRVVEVHIDG